MIAVQEESVSSHPPKTAPSYTQCHTQVAAVPQGATVSYTCPGGGVYGRYLSIWIHNNDALTLCEVKVYGGYSEYCCFIYLWFVVCLFV